MRLSDYQLKNVSDLYLDDIPFILHPAQGISLLEADLIHNRQACRASAIRSDSTPALISDLKNGRCVYVKSFSPSPELLGVVDSRGTPIYGLPLLLQTRLTHLIDGNIERPTPWYSGGEVNDAEISKKARAFIDAQVKKETLINDVWGAAKQVANDLIASQRTIFAEHLTEKNVIQVTDTKTGKILTSSEISERYKEIETFDLADEEQAGADAIKSVLHYDSVLLAAELATSAKKKIITNPLKVIDDITNARKDTRSPQEALGHLGGQYALKMLEIFENPDFVNRYHGPDLIGLDNKNRLVEIEYKGNNTTSTNLSVNIKNQRQGSNGKNKTRAQQMLHKSPKINVPSNRQGGMYLEKEIDLWRKINDMEGQKRHIASFTNTGTGRVVLYEQDNEGNLIKEIFNEIIPNFNEKKERIKKKQRRTK